MSSLWHNSRTHTRIHTQRHTCVLPNHFALHQCEPMRSGEYRNQRVSTEGTTPHAGYCIIRVWKMCVFVCACVKRGLGGQIAGGGGCHVKQGLYFPNASNLITFICNKLIVLLLSCLSFIWNNNIKKFIWQLCSTNVFKSAFFFLKFLTICVGSMSCVNLSRTKRKF